MTALGASIRLFLPSGDPDGFKLVTLSNWSGIASVAPRSEYPAVRAREEFKRPCVYILSGPGEGSTVLPRIYVGEGDEARSRLDQHVKTKDFWTEAIVFSSESGTLNKAHTRYLESRLIGLAQDAKRAELDNGNAPALPPLSEADKAEAEAFLQQILLLLPVLRQDGFDAAKDPSPGTGRMKLQGPDAEAEGKETADGFVVFSGSKARAQVVPSIHSYMAELRQELESKGILQPDGKHLVFAQDYSFNSPSTAAGVVLGRSANGRTEWKDEAGRTLKDLAAAAVTSDGPATLGTETPD